MRVLLVFVLCLAASTAAAQPVPAPVPSVPYVAQGRPAPFDGFLLRGEDLSQWRLRIEVLEHRLDIDLSAADRISEVRIQLEQSRTQAVEARLALRERLWREQAVSLSRDLVNARKDAVRSWYESPTLWFAIGVIITGIITGVFSVALVAL